MSAMSGGTPDNLPRPSTAYLSLGCNLGDCRANLSEAVRRLRAHESIEVTQTSSVYATEPVGNPDQPDFLNIAVGIKTALPPFELLSACQQIERDLGGREGRVPMGPRTIDIDIVLYEELEMEHAQLTIPHPAMLTRAFVLVPLSEIASQAPLPGGGSVATALGVLKDSHHIEKKDTLCL